MRKGERNTGTTEIRDSKRIDVKMQTLTLDPFG
jgi:hypothetical protein